MHYFGIVILQAEPNATSLASEVERILAPFGYNKNAYTSCSQLWDWFEIGGRWDNVIPGNIQPISDVRKALIESPPHFVVQESDDRSVRLMRKEIWNGMNWLTDDDWDDAFRRWIKEKKNVFVVGIDAHY